MTAVEDTYKMRAHTEETDIYSLARVVNRTVHSFVSGLMIRLYRMIS